MTIRRQSQAVLKTCRGATAKASLEDPLERPRFPRNWWRRMCKLYLLRIDRSEAERWRWALAVSFWIAFHYLNVCPNCFLIAVLSLVMANE